MPNLTVKPSMLKAVPLFSRFSDYKLAVLFPAIKHRSYARHAFMLRGGEKSDALYIILSGRARVVIDDGAGREVTLTLLGPHEFFGEMSFIDENPRSASVQALDACEVLYISKTALMSCLHGNVEAILLMLKSVIGRLRHADRQIAGLALMDVQGRVAQLLIEHARKESDEWVVDIGSEEMARMVGASREMVSRVIKAMRDEGVIRRDKRKIIVLDRASVDRRGGC